MDDQSIRNYIPKFVCALCGKENQKYGPFKSHFIQAHPEQLEDDEVPWNEDSLVYDLVSLNCEATGCNKKYTRKRPVAEESRFCSEKCERKHKTENNEYRHRERRGQEMKRSTYLKKQRELALARDNQECRYCKNRNEADSKRSTVVHHIVPGRLFQNSTTPHLIRNLITLCSDCHGNWEKEFWKLEDNEDPYIPGIRKQIQDTMEDLRKEALGQSEQRLRADMRYWETIPAGSKF